MSTGGWELPDGSNCTRSNTTVSRRQSSECISPLASFFSALCSHLPLEQLYPLVAPLLRQNEALELVPEVVVDTMDLVELWRSQSLKITSQV